MAVIEELVSKLGFEVEGLGKLKAAAKQFDATKKAVIASSNPLRAAGASAGIAAVGVGKLGAESKKSSRGVLLLSTALSGLRRAGAVAVTVVRTILGVMLRLAPALLGVVAALAAVALGFARAGSKAAAARREFALAAKEIGTSAQNLETVGNVLRVAGFGDGFADEAKKVVGSMDEILKAIKKGGDEADEAKKKLSGFGIDDSLKVDPKTGKVRDSAALALDVFQAYKRASEQAANLRKQADALGNKAPKKAASLRKKAIEQDRKSDQLAEDGGISGKLKVLLDGIALKDLPALFEKAARFFPTTSNKSESTQSDVAAQSAEAGLKVDALLKGARDRFTEIGLAIAQDVLPPINAFLDRLLAFAKSVNLIPESTGEKNARGSYERASERAAGMRAERTLNETPENRLKRQIEEREAELQRMQKDNERRSQGGTPTQAPLPPERPNSLPARDKDTSLAPRRTPTTAIRETQADIPAKLDELRRMLSPEANAAKMQKQAESKTDQRKYENIGNDQRTISPSITVNATGLEAVAAQLKASVLGAISTKGSNTSTGALTAP